jgi:hypothetical protein
MDIGRWKRYQRDSREAYSAEIVGGPTNLGKDHSDWPTSSEELHKSDNDLK